MKPIVFNPKAVSDLDEIVRYIAAENDDASVRVREAILDTAELLGKFPAAGCVPTFTAERFSGIRFIPVKRYRNYLLFYLEKANEVEVLRVLHGARDPRRFFTD